MQLCKVSSGVVVVGLGFRGGCRVRPMGRVMGLGPIDWAAGKNRTWGGRRRRTSNRSSARAARPSGEASASPVKTAQVRPGQSSCTARTAHQSTRSPPAPSLV
ncbi:hypothetical protein E2562_020125 [Oryza meyeriana var. granulata]|uniref:Uncharacterized protein n=1 Tax=Oryza meyeriana var. granulata TaxID=110450 RepID=A0A6G1BMD4_9ORYZ|nr:hypothetical protein E2562_020125 [Oryza meyeriana var. granulata]